MAMDGSKANPIVYFDEQGVGPREHVCSEAESPAERVQRWFDRKRLSTAFYAEQVALIEQLIEDLR